MTAPTYIIKDSPIAGRGLFAAQPVPTGETAVEYTGEIISKTESARRQSVTGNVFIFELDEQFDLDGDTPENPARFANHSCEPNCEAEAVGQTVQLRALREIATGEELTFDYGFRLAVFPGHPCRCGAPSCAGFIVGQADRWRMRRLLNRPGRSLWAKGKEVCA